MVEVFRRLGIADQVKDKVKQPSSGTQIAEMLARGDADLGFQQMSELAHVKGVDYLGPLPADVQNVTIYAAGAAQRGRGTGRCQGTGRISHRPRRRAI